MHITTDGLKKMAAEAVAAASGGNLNSAITKIAMDNEMNSDQVKRLVETTNQMAYLSQLGAEDDRTFEFDVAQYSDIMDNVISEPTIEKTAGSQVDPMSLVTDSFAAPMEKVATEKEATLEKWGKGQKYQALKKVASQERRRLDELKEQEHHNLVKLASHREVLLRDPQALEKMAKFDNQLEMTRMVFGHDKIASDVRHVWPEGELAGIQRLSDDLKLIKQASEEMALLEPKVEQAEAMLKEAFVQPMLNAARSAAGAAANAGSKVRDWGSKINKDAKRVWKTGMELDSANDIRKRSVKSTAWSNLRG